MTFSSALTILTDSLIALTLIYCIVLERRIRAFRKQEQTFRSLISDVSESTRLAQGAVSTLRHLMDEFSKSNVTSHRPILTNKISHDELFKEVSYELYLKEKQIDISQLDKPQQEQIKDKIEEHQISIRNKPFRSFSSNQLIRLKLSEKSKEMLNSYEETEITFEYNLTNLIPSTKYAFELSARVSNLESLSTKSLTFHTLSKIWFL